MRTVCMLFGAVVGIACLWMMPVWVMGYPIEVPGTELAYHFLQTRSLPAGADGRLSTVLLSIVARFTDRGDFLQWMSVSAVAMAAALPLLWGCVARLFDRRTAWITLFLFSLMPIYWMEVLDLNAYTFSFFFLFASGYVFLFLVPRSRLVGLLCTGALFGAVVATKNVFLTFLPWIVLLSLWSGRQNIVRRGKEVALFVVAVVMVYIAPVMFFPSDPTLSFADRLVEASPVGGTLDPLEFYPDLYTFEHEKEWYDSQYTEGSFYDQVRLQHRLLSLGIEDPSILRTLVSGTWLLVHSGVLPLLHQDTVGGALLWLFLLPGGVVLFRRHRRLFVAAVGLMLSVQILIRYGLHFQRVHLMNDGWILACVAALGVGVLADALAKEWKKASPAVVAVLLLIVVGMQFVQANRVQLAREYARSRVPAQLAASAVAKELPADVRIATPSYDTLGELVDRETVLFAPSTLDRLRERSEVAGALDLYGVTHVLGYDEERSEALQSLVSQEVLFVPRSSVRPKPSAVLQYLLHLIR